MNTRALAAAAAVALTLAGAAPAHAFVETTGWPAPPAPAYSRLYANVPANTVWKKADDGKDVAVKSFAGLTCTNTIIPLKIWPFSDSKFSCAVEADADTRTIYEELMKGAVEHDDMTDDGAKLKMLHELLCRKAGGEYRCRTVVEH